MNTQHTPYMIREFDSETLAGPGYNLMAGDRVVATVGPCNAYGVEVEQEARLLAAAPALLAAAEAALEIVGVYTLGSAEAARRRPVEAKLRAAIKQAKEGAA